MNGSRRRYRDRFGNVWSVEIDAKRGKPTHVSFTCGELRLVAVDGEMTDGTNINAARLKELFCDAERVVVHEEEVWYIGFRKRMGRGGRPQAGMHIRFRSESGEVRYAKSILHFRHMPIVALREQLVAAQTTGGKPAVVRRTT